MAQRAPVRGQWEDCSSPHTLSNTFSFFLSLLFLGICCLQPPPPLTPPFPPPSSPSFSHSFFFPYRSSGPIVWTASSILSFSSGSLFRPSDMVSSSQRLMESQDVQTHTYFVLISSVFNRPHAQLQPCVCSREEGCTLTSTFLGLLYCRSAQQPARVLFV